MYILGYSTPNLGRINRDAQRSQATAIPVATNLYALRCTKLYHQRHLSSLAITLSMDSFYLKNAAWYRSLIENLDPTSLPSLHGQRKDRQGRVNVAVRIRPQSEDDVSAGYPCALFPMGMENGIVRVHDLHHYPRGRPTLKVSKYPSATVSRCHDGSNCSLQSFQYAVDKVFRPDVETQVIYKDMVENLIPLARNGNIGTVFAYGQTGSGKTFTVAAIAQLVTDTIMDASFGEGLSINFAAIELAGNSTYDLLHARTPVTLLENDQGVIHWRGATDLEVRNKDEMLSLMERATSLRSTEPTVKNKTSSRSHGIYRICFKNSMNATEGYLYLIDLAGSEGARDVASHKAERMQESREINTSLSVLKDCIRGKVESDRARAAGEAQTPHIPIRGSSLTKVLKHVFDNDDSRVYETVVIACLNPSLPDVGPSKNTLRYAEMIRGSQPNAVKRNIWDR